MKNQPRVILGGALCVLASLSSGRGGEPAKTSRTEEVLSRIRKVCSGKKKLADEDRSRVEIALRQIEGDKELRGGRLGKISAHLKKRESASSLETEILMKWLSLEHKYSKLGDVPAAMDLALVCKEIAFDPAESTNNRILAYELFGKAALRSYTMVLRQTAAGKNALAKAKSPDKFYIQMSEVKFGAEEEPAAIQVRKLRSMAEDAVLRTIGLLKSKKQDVNLRKRFLRNLVLFTRTRMLDDDSVSKHLVPLMKMRALAKSERLTLANILSQCGYARAEEAARTFLKSNSQDKPE